MTNAATKNAEAPRTMSVGRDYNTYDRYEFVIFEGEEVLLRDGGFKSAATARRAGIRANDALNNA